MSDRFAVEADRRVVGVAVRGPGGYRFFSSDPDFVGLESRTYPRARALARSVARLARARRREAGTQPRSASIH